MNPQNPSPFKFENVYLIGLGGVGSNLLRPLFHYLSSLGSAAPSLTLIDGDKVEPSNLSRQIFSTNDLTQFKVKALYDQVVAAKNNPDFTLYQIPRFFDEELGKKGLVDRSLILSAVDNHKTNKMISDACERLNNVVHICATGHYHHGTVITHAKWKGHELLPKITEFHPEIANPEDAHPNDPSCMQTASQGGPQIITTNLTCATVMLQLVAALVTGEPVPNEVNFTSQRFRAIPMGPLQDLVALLAAKTAPVQPESAA